MKNHKHTTLSVTTTILLVFWGMLTEIASAQTYIIDQENKIGELTSLGMLIPGQSLGQSFTPTLSGIDQFDFLLSSRGVSTVRFNLLSGETVSGIPIATSQEIVINNSSLARTVFSFPAPVAVTPGALYTGRLDLIAGDSYQLALSQMNPYSRGVAFNQAGVNITSADLVFSEGIIIAVPEPTTLMLFGGTSVCVLLFRRFRNVQKAPR